MRKAILGIVMSMCLLAAVATQAQDEKKLPLPLDKIGLGVKIDNVQTGINFAYAIQSNIHIGTGLGFGYNTGTDTPGDDGGTLLAVSPFFRYIFANEANLFPYAEFNFQFTEFVYSSSFSTANIELGGMWFPFTTVSVYGGFSFFNYNIDNSSAQFGALSSHLGIYWFFD